MKNFKIGTEINRILKNGNIKGLKDKIFPLIANANTTFPFLIYRRTSYSPQSNKDFIGERINIEINICTETYEEMVEISNQVADTLISVNQVHGNESEIIDFIVLFNVSEFYMEDTFVQNLQFIVEFKNDF